MLGLSLSTFTLLHVLVSLVALVSGLVIIKGLFAGRRLDRWTAVFLSTTTVTSVTGYGFPVDHVLPSHIVGGISLFVLTGAIVARYLFHLRGAWRRVYVIAAVLAVYLNAFVALVQAFLKVPTLKALAPTQAEAPFAIAQVALLALFVALGTLAAIRFRIERADGPATPD
jgi:hypothetical protein